MQHQTQIVLTDHDDMQVLSKSDADFVVLRVRYGKAKEEHSSSDAGVWDLVIHKEIAKKVFTTALGLANNEPIPREPVIERPQLIVVP